MNECTNDPSICIFGEGCPIHEIWCKTQWELVDRLRHSTFADFINRN